MNNHGPGRGRIGRIDTINGGQTCLDCQHYKPEWKRRDRFFGDLPVQSWCVKRNGTVRPDEGQDCIMFLRTLFTRR